MKIFNLETIRLILLQNGTSRNLGVRLIGALSTSLKWRHWRERTRRREQVKRAKQQFLRQVLKLLWAMSAFLWPIHRVLRHNFIKKKKGLCYNRATTFVINACNINCFYCSAFWNKQRSGSVCARQHENKTPNLPLAAFSLNKQPNISPRKEYTTTMTAGGCKQVVKAAKQKGVI